MAVSRRHFFFGSLLAGVVPSGGFGSALSLKALGYKSPNEKLNIASIGASGRPFQDLAGCDTENIVALADVNDLVAAPAFRKYEKAVRYRDFRKMLDKEINNVDAVIVGCPDHMHGTCALWAMERGKHVYVEKPLTRTVAEARMLTEAAAKYKVATQMGNQGYSNDGARVAAEILWSGEIGDVREVHAWTSRPIWPQGLTEMPAPEPVPSTLDWDLWLGIAAYRPFTSGGEAYANRRSATYGDIPVGYYLPFNWRGFVDFGCGPLGDMACHILGAPNMALRLSAPSSVECIRKEGTSPFQFPKKTVTRFEFPARGSMPPVTLYWYDAATGPMYRPKDLPEDEPLIGGPGSFGRPQAPAATAAQRPATGNPPAATGRAPIPGREGAVFVGDKGYMTTDTYGANVRLLPQSRHDAYKLPAEWLSRSPGHHRDWIRACKGGEAACSNFNVAGPFAEWVVMGVIALQVEGKLEWDSEKMRFTNSAEANRLVHPYVRKGWSLT